MTSTTVQTSARDTEPDMFGGVDLASGQEICAAALIEIRGELIADAEVRTKLVGVDAQPLPVVCLEVRPLSGAQHTVHADWIYTEASRKQAEKVAATLKRGARVTVTTPLVDMRTILPHVASVALIPSPKATS